ncbi:MAG TPA: hypothetical protein EYN67_11005, partial [Flavobacteriales bacterium]|nr:hypothetical protein [Flavobacteriales bacterium]
MPIIDLNKNYVSGMQAPMQPLEQPKEVDHSTGTIFGAAMRQSNMVGSFVSSLETRAIVDVAKEDMVEGYNPLDDNLDGYELDLFTSSFSPRATQAIKDQADKERKDKQILSEAGALGFGMEIGATLLDPAQWGLAVSTGGLGWVGKGASLTTKAVRAGIVSGSTEVVIEGGLHYTQNSRTLLESAMNVGGATVFGGLLFGGAAKFMDIKTSKLQKLADDHQVNVNNPAYDSTLPENIELINMSSADHQNMGAALRGTIESLDDLGVAGVAGRVLEKTQGSELGKAVTLSTPAHRGVTTESVTFRNLNSRLFETSFVLNKNYGGNLETSLSKGLASANVKGLINESSNDLTVEAFEIELKALVSAKIENKISPLEAGQEAFNETLHKHFSEFDNDSGYVRGFREAYTKEYSRDGLASNFSAETLIANESDAVQVVMFKAAKKATQEAKAEGGAPRTLAD